MGYARSMVVGIDEVGRGSLAGPLVIGIVALNEPISGLRDSKKLSKAKRLSFAIEIYKQAAEATLGWVWPHEIDSLGLTEATSLSIKRALALLKKQPDRVILDGNYNYLPNHPNVETIIGADDTIPEVSAASIIAKVARDSYMQLMDNHFPDYDFKTNVGYGTASHINLIRENGPCVLHRTSFKLKSL